jgi:hypothetical protein
MSKEDGNTNDAVNKRWADFVGEVCQALWPALKPAIVSGKFDFKKFDTISKKLAALRRGFLQQDKKTGTGLDIGKVTEEQMAKLSVWDMKNLYGLFYEQVFGLHVSFPDELMPEAPDEFAWPICIPGIMSNEAAYHSGKSDMPKRKYNTDKPLDSIMQLDRGRDAWTHSYIVRTPADFEAGEKWKNLSGNDIDSKKINVLMFRERWILGLFIYWLTGLQLDRTVVTGTGSRDSDGYVVDVDWFGDKARVGWCIPDDADDNLRFREAVS